MQTLDELKARHVTLTKQIAQRRSVGQSTDDLLLEAKTISKQIKALEAAQKTPTELQPSDSLQLEVLTTIEQVQHLGPQWQELHRIVAPENPWISWEWMVSWYEVYGDRGEIHCLTIRDNIGNLIGVIPCFISERRVLGIKHRTMRFASTYGRTRGLHLTPICAREDRALVYAKWSAYLERPEVNCDRVYFDNITASDDGLWALLAVLCDRGWHCRVNQANRVYTMMINSGIDNLSKLLNSRHLRKDIAAQAKRLSIELPYVKSHYLKPSIEQIDNITERHADLSILRFKSLISTTASSRTYQESAFIDYACRKAWIAAAKRFTVSGWLRVALMEDRDEIIATSVGILCGTVLRLWGSSWHPSLASYQVSHLTRLQLMRGAYGDGARMFDFGHGLHPWKQQYTKDYQQLLCYSGLPSIHAIPHRIGTAVENATLSALSAFSRYRK